MKTNFTFEINGFCEHCSMIPGPMYFGSFRRSISRGPDYCIDCLYANDLDEKTYNRYNQILAPLKEKYLQQMEELKEIEQRMFLNRKKK